MEPNTRYLNISGRGAVRSFVFKTNEKKIYYGPKNNTDPKVRYNMRERYQHYLLKAYEGKPFQFLDKFSRFVVKHNNHYYKNIFNILKRDYLKKQPKLRKERKFPKFLPNRYVVLKNSEGTEFQSRFSESTLQYIDESESSFCFDFKAGEKAAAKIKAAKQRRHHQRIVDNKNFSRLLKLCKEKIIPEFQFRNSLLLNKIHHILFKFRLARLTKSSRYNILEKRINYEENLRKFYQTFEAQMDEMSAQGEKVCPEIVSKGNTLQESQRGASEGKPAQIVSRIKKMFSKFASSETSPDYGDLTDRFFPHKTYSWSNEDRNKKLAELTLPYDFVVTNPNSANCTLFNSYSYWDGDMEIKIMVNANKFQIGQLQMSWYYGQDYEQNFERRGNVYVASQQAHCLVSASTSNEGKLYIPFRYYKPKMGTKKRDDDPGRLNMGKLTVRVLNQLSSPSTVYKECKFTISFRFVNSNFSGMISRDLGVLEGNMFAIRSAMRVLEELNQDPQRDNPPDVRPSNPVIPWSSHSWSIGDRMVEPINTLRLQAPGQTPHPAEVTPQYDEMNISHIVNIFGLVRTIKWESGDRSGELLFEIDGAPIMSANLYHMDIYDQSECFTLPPVAVLSNLFAYWRGSLELRLDVIASPFHTGRLLIAYIPRIMESPTWAQVKSSPHAIFDLQGESRQFLFKIPYIADRPWWHTKGFGNNILPPSRVYCYILNDLVPMDNVDNFVEINIYMRGCSDFELSVPVTSRIGLSTYNAFVHVGTEDIASTRDGYTPIYYGAWHSFENSKKPVLRYGNVSDHVVQFNNLVKGNVYTPDKERNGTDIRGKANRITWYIVGIPVDTVGDQCKYATYFADLTKAFAYAATYNTIHIENFSGDTDWFDKPDGTRFDSTMYFRKVQRPVIANMDERSSVSVACNDGILPELLSTKSGLLTFGETFNDLKSLCRRYQLYLTHKETIEPSYSCKQRIKIPLLPQGIPRTNSELESISVYNYNREGVIPIIASAFRFYRGGLRFRFVWRSAWDCTIRLEHRPDERLENLSLDVPIGHKSLYNDGYAFMIQNTKINNIIEFEVPFYQCGVLGLLQNPKLANNLESYHYSLGNLYVSFSCKAKDVANFDLYYSIADDCRFSVFQGFPSMIFCPNNRLEMEPQMGIFSSAKETFTNITETFDKFNKVADKVDALLPEPDAEEQGTEVTVEEIKEGKESMFEWITKTIPSQFRATMINGISQLFHCFISPTAKTIAWAVASFFAQIGLLCSSLVTSFAEYFTKFISIFRRGKSESAETKQTSEEILEANMDESSAKEAIAVKAGILSTVVTSIAAALGCVGRLPKTIPDFLKGIWNNMGKFAFTTNTLCTFFKNNLRWITDAYKWVLAKCFPNRSLATELEGSDADLKEFTKEAQTLVSEVNARKVEHHPRWNLRVYACAAKAQLLYSKMCLVNNAPKTPALFSLIQQIIKKRDHLVKFTLSPPVRFEPMVLNITGDCNIGKSHLCQEIGKNLLKTINYKTYSELIYTRTPGNPYWNQLRNQPICLFDDFINIGGEHGLQQVAELYCLKSRAIFNPPQADISDKHIRYNPLLVFLASNKAFPKIAGIEYISAFYRRRDMLIQVDKHEEFYKKHKVDLVKGSPREFKASAIKNYEHLRFRLYKDVKDSESTLTDSMTYEELVKLLEKQFVSFYEREMELYEKAIKEAYDFYPEDEDVIYAAENLEKQRERINNINKFRFGSIGELKTFLNDVVPTIDSDKKEIIVPILSPLKTLALYDPRSVKFLILQNLFIKKYIETHKITELTKLIEEDSPGASRKNSRGYDTTDTPNLNDIAMNIRQQRAKIEVYKDGGGVDQIDAVLEGNMFTARGPEGSVDRLDICVHSVFDEEIQFMREKSEMVDGKYFPGFFLNPIGGTKFSEQECDGYCAWKEGDKLKKDMEKWVSYKYGHDRRVKLQNRDFENLPMYFKAISPLLDKENKFAEEVKKETEGWLMWSKRMLQAAGNGLWTCLKWASKVVVLLSAVMAFAGTAYHLAFPHSQKVSATKNIVAKNLIYEGTKQEEMAKYDAKLLTEASLLKYEHESQKLFPEGNKSESQMVASGDHKTFGKSTPKQVRDVAIKLVANLAKEKELVVIRAIQRNTFFIQAEANCKVLTGRILGIIDHYAITVNHYHDKFKEFEDVFILGRNFKIKVKYSDLKYTPFQDSSLGYYKLPGNIPSFRNLIKHIASQNEHRHVGPVSRLIEPMWEDTTTIVSEQYCERINNVKIDSSNGFEEFAIPDGYKYARGGRGICGSVLVSTHLENPIYGIHVAGDITGKVGMSEAIVKEQFEHLIELCKIQDVIEPNMEEWNPHFMAPQSHSMILGVVPSVVKHHESGQTKIIPTECHGEIFDVYCDTPVLSFRDERIKDDPFSPIQEGINKHGLVTKNFPEEWLETASSDLKNVILAKVKPVRGIVGKLSKSVAVVGDAFVEGFDKLDFNTSEGFPFVACRTGGKRSKSWLLDLEQQEDGRYIYKGCDPMLTEIMKAKKAQRKERHLPFTVFTDCLKDHKLPKEKACVRGKVRIFSISPIDFTIQSRQNFMDFTVSYQNARFNAEHAIGIDVNSYEWTELALKLLNHSSKIATADYKGFGPSLNLACAYKAIEIIREWYKFNHDNNPINDIMREMLGYELMYSVHLVGRTVYRTLCGLPSGSPLTVILNSLINSLYIRLAWICTFNDNINYVSIKSLASSCEQESTLEQQFKAKINATMDSFHKNVIFLVYGDDIIFAIKDEACEHFNCATFADALTKFDISIQNACKGKEIVKYLSLLDKDTTFLKNNFIMHPTKKGVFLAALDITSVEDTLNWTYKEWSNDLRSISLTASDACIRNAFGHGPTVYEQIRDRVFTYWLRKGEYMHTPSWNELEYNNFNTF